MAKLEEATEQSNSSEFAKLDQILQENRGQRGVLINVLHQAQQIFGHLSRELQIYIAEGLDVPFSKVYGVVSFYSLFSTEPRGEYTIEVCTGTACYVKGAEDILAELKSQLEIEPGETTTDGLFTLETTRSIGACGMAPIIKVGADTHGRITTEKIPEILDSYRSGGQE